MKNWSDEILYNGTRVIINGTELKGHIDAINITGIGNDHVEYAIVWYAGGTRHRAWLQRFEFEVLEDNSKKPGMVNYETDPNRLLT